MLHHLTAVQLAKKVRDKEVGCVELLEYFLDRCRRYNESVNAIIVWNTEAARIRAEAADVALEKGDIWGPLHGVPMTIKESYDVSGLPTTWGVPEYKSHVAQTNAVVVDRMLKAGVVLFGKTNVPLLLGDWQTFNEIYGTTSNPWDLERVPGGSSGGSAAALSAGLTGIESGSDIGGAIRNPAHYCGVYGHKPTWGVVPVRGQALPGDLADTDIAVVGPLARGADDLAVALKCMAGSDDLESDGWKLDLVKPIKRRLSEFRVAVMLSDDNCPVDGEYGDQIQRVVDMMARKGVVVSDSARPDIDLARSHAVYLQLLRAVTTARQPLDCFEQNRKKSAALKPDDDDYFARNLRASVQYHREWMNVNEERTKMRWRWYEFFQDWDLLLCPVASSAAFFHDQQGERPDRVIVVNGKPQCTMDQLFWAGMSSVVYLPSTVAPVGCTRSRLPVGVQMIGPSMHDLRIIDFARLLTNEIGGFQPPPGYD